MEPRSATHLVNRNVDVGFGRLTSLPISGRPLPICHLPFPPLGGALPRPCPEGFPVLLGKLAMRGLPPLAPLRFPLERLPLDLAILLTSFPILRVFIASGGHCGSQLRRSTYLRQQTITSGRKRRQMDCCPIGLPNRPAFHRRRVTANRHRCSDSTDWHDCHCRDSQYHLLCREIWPPNGDTWLPR